MSKNFQELLEGYHIFRKKYADGDQSIMQYLSYQGQKPQTMVIACCDSRVDPAVILQCDPGDLFVVRNVASIVPPYEKDGAYHGTSAALEFGVRFLNVKHLILLGHSQCGGIEALIKGTGNIECDFITKWVSVLKSHSTPMEDTDTCVKHSLNISEQNCLSFPWIAEKVKRGELMLHLWFFHIESGQIYFYCPSSKTYRPIHTS